MLNNPRERVRRILLEKFIIHNGREPEEFYQDTMLRKDLHVKKLHDICYDASRELGCRLYISRTRRDYTVRQITDMLLAA